MARDSNDPDLWQALLDHGEGLATEEDYEHGYEREIRGDLQQYLAFHVAQEMYAVSITEIAEISKPLFTTPVPRTAAFVLGIANVRGTVIPILDLAKRLRLPSRPSNRQTRVLIVRHQGDLYGMVVDSVVGVISIAPENLEDAPGALSGPRGEFIHALARHSGEILVILDLRVLLDSRDFIAPGVTAVRRMT